MPLNALEVLNNITVPVQVIDREFRFVFANPSFLEVFGKSWEDLAGKYVFDVFPESPQRIAEVTATFERVLDGELTSTKEQSFSLPLPNGRLVEKIWSVDGAPLFDASGEVQATASKVAVLVAQTASHVLLSASASATPGGKHSARGPAPWPERCRNSWG